MLIEGNKNIAHNIEAVWNALIDPEKLKASIPGCNVMEKTEENKYRFHIKIKVAAIVGEYEGEISIVDPKPMTNYGLDISGSGALGHMKAKVDIGLNALNENETEMQYKGEAEIGGKVAKVGQRVLSSVANLIVKQFFNSFVKQI